MASVMSTREQLQNPTIFLAPRKAVLRDVASRRTASRKRLQPGRLRPGGPPQSLGVTVRKVPLLYPLAAAWMDVSELEVLQLSRQLEEDLGRV